MLFQLQMRKTKLAFTLKLKHKKHIYAKNKTKKFLKFSFVYNFKYAKISKSLFILLLLPLYNNQKLLNPEYR